MPLPAKWIVARLDAVKRRIMQLEIERQALSKEKDQASKDRLVKIEETLANLKEEEHRLTAQLQSERAGQQGVRDLKEQLEKANAELEAAQRNYDLNKAAELRFGRIPELAFRWCFEIAVGARP